MVTSSTHRRKQNRVGEFLERDFVSHLTFGVVAAVVGVVIGVVAVGNKPRGKLARRPCAVLAVSMPP